VVGQPVTPGETLPNIRFGQRLRSSRAPCSEAFQIAVRNVERYPHGVHEVGQPACRLPHFSNQRFLPGEPSLADVASSHCKRRLVSAHGAMQTQV
jgi:hypothetical protein